MSYVLFFLLYRLLSGHIREFLVLWVVLPHLHFLISMSRLPFCFSIFSHLAFMSGKILLFTSVCQQKLHRSFGSCCVTLNSLSHFGNIMSLAKNLPHPAHLLLPPSRQSMQVNFSLLGGFFPVVDVTVMSSLQILHFTKTWTKLSLAFSSFSLKSTVMAKAESEYVAGVAGVAAIFSFFLSLPFQSDHTSRYKCLCRRSRNLAALR